MKPIFTSKVLRHFRIIYHWNNIHINNTRCVSYLHGPSDIPLLGTTIGQLLHKRAEEYPDKQALVVCHQQVELSYSQLLDQSDQLAAGLQAIGLKKGDRVGIWAPNCIEWVLTKYAAARAGMILVNINPAYRVPELQHAMKKVRMKAIVSAKQHKSQDYYAMLCEACPELETSTPGDIKSQTLPDLKSVIVISDERLNGTWRFADVMSAGSESEKRSLMDMQSQHQFDEPFNIQFTSGTTGFPKGAVLTHHNIINNSYFTARILGYHEKDHRVCITVPLHHCFAMVLGSLASLTCGATSVFPAPAWDPKAALNAVQQHQCTSLYGTPTMFIDMLAAAEQGNYDLSSLSTGIMGGSPCPVEIIKRIVTELNMTDVSIAYGTTENSPLTFQTRRGTPLEKLVQTVGEIHPHVEAKVVDSEGRILPPGEQGEMWTRGYGTMLGYYGDEEKTKESILPDRWYKTGDLAVIDEDGYARIVGRIKDMIIRGGENIFPAEIENFLHKHPKIEAVQVFGVPDTRLGEEVCAWVRLRKGEEAIEQDIKDFCNGQLANFKIPRYVMFVNEFPLTATNKVQKFVMREQSIMTLGLESS